MEYGIYTAICVHCEVEQVGSCMLVVAMQSERKMALRNYVAVVMTGNVYVVFPWDAD